MDPTINSDTDASTELERLLHSSLDPQDEGSTPTLATPAPGASSERPGAGVRLYSEGCQRREERLCRLQAERERRLAQRYAEWTYTPTITTRAQERPARGPLLADHFAAWEEARQDRRRHAARAQRRADDIRSPRVDPHSMEIAERHDYRGPVGDWYARAEEFEAARRLPSPDRHMFRPNINGTVDTPGSSVFRRLYEDSSIRLEHREERLEAARAAKEDMADKSTGVPFFSPVCWSQRPRGGGGPVHQRLYRLAKDSASRPSLDDATAQSCSFSPAIDRRSKRMECQRKPLYSTPRRVERSATHNSPSQPPSRPRRSEPSPNDVEDAFLKRARADMERRRQHHTTRVEERRQVDGAVCVFTPTLNDRSVELAYAARSKEDVSPAEREADLLQEPVLPHHGPTGGHRDAERIVSAFESQMFEVLDEWRQLEAAGNA